MNRKLYEIRPDLMAAIEYAIYGDEVDKPEKELEELEMEAEEKLVAYFHVINRLKAEAAEADVVINTAQEYKSKRTKTIERLEEDMRVTMEFCMIDKIDRPDCRITLGKPRQIVDVIDPQAVMSDDFPDEFMILVPATRKYDKVKILETLKAGKEVPGCRLSYSKPSLRYPKLKGE